MRKILLRIILVIVVLAGLGAAGFFGAHLVMTRIVNKPVEAPVFDPYEMPIDSIAVERYWDPETLADLVEDSTLIVRGYLLDNAIQKIEYTDGTEDVIKSGFNRSTLVVVESYKGGLHAGDKVPMVERYYILTTQQQEEKVIDGKKMVRTVDEDHLITYNYYMPSTPGTEYIFFLTKQANDAKLFPGQYYIQCLEKGRYPCLTEKQLKKGVAAIDNKTLRLNIDTPEEYRTGYLALYQEVVDIYIDPPTEEEVAEALAKEGEQQAKESGKGRLPLIPIIAGGAGAVAVAGGVFLLLRRRKQKGGGEDIDGDVPKETETQKSRVGIGAKMSGLLKRGDKKPKKT